MTDIVQEEWYMALVEECKAIVTEAVFTSRWSLVEGYWNLGERIRTDQQFQEYAKGNHSSFQDLGRNLGISTSTIYYSLQFFDKYPDISKVPEGKNITWNKLITKYLPEPPENKIEIPVPKGKYSTIIVDPPWPDEFSQLGMNLNQTNGFYKAMTIEQIRTFSVPAKIAADNCNLFLWTNHTYLPDALEIVKAWGFKYHILLTWDKISGRSLFGFNRRTEFVVYAYKGKIAVSQRGQLIDTLFTEKLHEHSYRPEAFYLTLLSCTPAPRIDIFSKEQRAGFDQYENQIDEIEKTGGGEKP